MTNGTQILLSEIKVGDVLRYTPDYSKFSAEYIVVELNKTKSGRFNHKVITTWFENGVVSSVGNSPRPMFNGAVVDTIVNIYNR